jgi:hypothetical protein
MDDATSGAWRKSGYSQGGNCVEWRFADDAVQIRNSREDEGPVLIFTRAEWQAFVSGAKSGEADPPG